MLRYYVDSVAPDRSENDLNPSQPVIETMKMRVKVSRLTNILRSSRCQKGFTLVELLVVVAVFAILITLTLPDYMKGRPQRLLSGEANRLAGTLRQARLVALRDNAKAYVEFIPELDMYRLWSESGWRAYADPVMAPGEPAGRNPDIGDYDGDFDGDGDFWWGDGGDPSSPSGTPEDQNVKQDSNGNWYYDQTNWDGSYTDPDVLLMPTYPGNQPLRTVSPKLIIDVDPATGNITNIVRDLSGTGGVSGEGIVPLDVDLRMRNLAENWDPTAPIGKRNGVLSHFPLIFITFFPDGTLAASWDVSSPPNGFANEVIDLKPGGLGAVKLYLQIRGNEYNQESYNLFDPTVVVQGDEGPGEPASPYNTLSVEKSVSDANGRTLTINNLSGRIIIRNFAPKELDDLHTNFGIDLF